MIIKNCFAHLGSLSKEAMFYNKLCERSIDSMERRKTLTNHMAAAAQMMYVKLPATHLGVTSSRWRLLWTFPL